MKNNIIMWSEPDAIERASDNATEVLTNSLNLHTPKVSPLRGFSVFGVDWVEMAQLSLPEPAWKRGNGPRIDLFVSDGTLIPSEMKNPPEVNLTGVAG